MSDQLSTDPCHPERVEAYLDGVLSPDATAAFVDHLDQCPECQLELQQQAAADSTWHDYRQALQDQPHDSVRLSDTLAGDTITVGGTEDDAAADNSAAYIQQVTALLSPSDDPEMLGRIAGYEVCGVIGAGGMGVVFKAFDRSLDRMVAIKVMAPHLASSGPARKRFARESKAAAAVLHPNVVAIHGVSHTAQLPYLVMPYIRGRSLQARIDREGPLPVLSCLRVAAQVAAGLAAAHDQGLVHRDIKPANILLEEGVERVAITDFGLARAVDDASMTRSGVIAGTPQYMSPEQARGEPIDARSDLFSLGSLLYAMCTGHPPFRAETSFGVLHRIAQSRPRPIREINVEVPDWLVRLVDGLHHKRPADRWPSAASVHRMLIECIAHLERPDHQRLPSALRNTSSLTISRAALWTSAAVLVVLFTAWVANSLLRSESGWSSRGSSAPVADQGQSNRQSLEAGTPSMSGSQAGGDSQLATSNRDTRDSAALIPPAELVELNTRWHDPFEVSTAEIQQLATQLERATAAPFETARSSSDRSPNE